MIPRTSSPPENESPSNLSLSLRAHKNENEEIRTLLRSRSASRGQCSERAKQIVFSQWNKYLPAYRQPTTILADWGAWPGQALRPEPGVAALARPERQKAVASWVSDTSNASPSNLLGLNIEPLSGALLFNESFPAAADIPQQVASQSQPGSSETTPRQAEITFGTSARPASSAYGLSGPRVGLSLDNTPRLSNLPDPIYRVRRFSLSLCDDPVADVVNEARRSWLKELVDVERSKLTEVLGTDVHAWRPNHTQREENILVDWLAEASEVRMDLLVIDGYMANLPLAADTHRPCVPEDVSLTYWQEDFGAFLDASLLGYVSLVHRINRPIDMLLAHPYSKEAAYLFANMARHDYLSKKLLLRVTPLITRRLGIFTDPPARTIASASLLNFRGKAAMGQGVIRLLAGHLKSLLVRTQKINERLLAKSTDIFTLMDQWERILKVKPNSSPSGRALIRLPLRLHSLRLDSNFFGTMRQAKTMMQDLRMYAAVSYDLMYCQVHRVQKKMRMLLDSPAFNLTRRFFSYLDDDLQRSSGAPGMAAIFGQNEASLWPADIGLRIGTISQWAHLATKSPRMRQKFLALERTYRLEGNDERGEGSHWNWLQIALQDPCTYGIVPPEGPKPPGAA